eukprot:SAG11_NODE_91_length_17102_cov_37.671343_15_plen_165_part_00
MCHWRSSASHFLTASDYTTQGWLWHSAAGARARGGCTRRADSWLSACAGEPCQHAAHRTRCIDTQGACAEAKQLSTRHKPSAIVCYRRRVGCLKYRQGDAMREQHFTLAQLAALEKGFKLVDQAVRPPGLCAIPAALCGLSDFERSGTNVVARLPRPRLLLTRC